jgi:hypothetical protein
MMIIEQGGVSRGSGHICFFAASAPSAPDDVGLGWQDILSAFL